MSGIECTLHSSLPHFVRLWSPIVTKQWLTPHCYKLLSKILYAPSVALSIASEAVYSGSRIVAKKHISFCVLITNYIIIVWAKRS